LKRNLQSSLDRYSRQVRFAPFGVAGQKQLAEACVAVLGCGALGTFSAGALARAGVGHLRLIDRDVVEWSNLQRQWLFEEADAHEGALKAEAARRRLAAINSEIQVEALAVDLDARNIEDLLEGVGLVVDATDNFETRFLLNDYCVSTGIPWVYGAAVGSYGLAFPILPGLGPCLRCVYPAPPGGIQPTCETAGVLNSITSLVAAWQTGLATRILAAGVAGVPITLARFDTWKMETRQTPLTRDPDCPCCGHGEYRFLDGRRRAPVSLCGRNAVQIHEREGAIDLAALEAQLTGIGPIRRNEFALRFEPQAGIEMTVFPDGRAIVKGTTDVGAARGLYARYLGR
jgi:adenylyltransferase/sulfurtransferase